MVKETKGSTSVKYSGIRKKSPARTKSPSRKGPASKTPTESKSSDNVVTQRSTTKKSPVRNKSPSRRSPGRPKKEHSPARVSPKRKSPSRAAALESKSATRKAIVQLTKLETELSGSDEEFIPKEKPKATVRGRTRKLDLEEFVQTTIKLSEPRVAISSAYSGDIRRLTRNSQSQEERVVHLKHYDTVAKKLGEFSDDETSSAQIGNAAPVKKKKLSFLNYSSILIQFAFVPLFVVGIFVLCNESKCSLSSLPDWRKLSSLHVFFDLRSFLGYCILAVTLALLSALPFGGRRVSSLPGKQPKFTYITNGAFSLIAVLLFCGVVECYWFSLSAFIVKHILHIVVSVPVFATLFSVYLYFKSLYAPVSALSTVEVDSPVLSGFYYGRELNPRVFNVLDLKMWVMRLSTVAFILVDVALLIKGLHLDTELVPAIKNFDSTILTSHPTLLVLVMLHLIYFVGHMVVERIIISTYYMQYEALGCSNMTAVLILPFLLIAQTKYVVEHKVHYANWELAVASLIFVIGYALYIVGNDQKDTFRKNPYSYTSTKFDSISTTQGKKLLCSGCWGFVRQPNVLGDIVLHLALLRFGLNAPPALGIIAIILTFVDRVLLTQNDCKKKYGASWDKYCQKVKYVLVPKVY